MRDVVFLIGWGLCMAGAAQLYALTDWAVPVLLDKSGVMPAASHAAAR